MEGTVESGLIEFERNLKKGKLVFFGICMIIAIFFFGGVVSYISSGINWSNLIGFILFMWISYVVFWDITSWSRVVFEGYEAILYSKRKAPIRFSIPDHMVSLNKTNEDFVIGFEKDTKRWSIDSQEIGNRNEYINYISERICLGLLLRDGSKKECEISDFVNDKSEVFFLKKDV